MIDRPRDGTVRRDPTEPAAPAAPADLFAWSGGGIVLIGERHADRWIVARGWRQHDRLSDVRRWSFADRHAFAGQIRRLVRDATADRVAGIAAAAEALAWSQRSDAPPA